MNLTEEAQSYAMDRATTPAQLTALQRAFMAGALAALTSKAPAEQLRAECFGFGRAVGTAAERAAIRTTRCTHGVSELNRCARCD